MDTEFRPPTKPILLDYNFDMASVQRRLVAGKLVHFKIPKKFRGHSSQTKSFAVGLVLGLEETPSVGTVNSYPGRYALYVLIGAEPFAVFYTPTFSGGSVCEMIALLDLPRFQIQMSYIARSGRPPLKGVPLMPVQSA